MLCFVTVILSSFTVTVMVRLSVLVDLILSSSPFFFNLKCRSIRRLKKKKPQSRFSTVSLSNEILTLPFLVVHCFLSDHINIEHETVKETKLYKCLTVGLRWAWLGGCFVVTSQIHRSPDSFQHLPLY